MTRCPVGHVRTKERPSWNVSLRTLPTFFFFFLLLSDLEELFLPVLPPKPATSPRVASWVRTTAGIPVALTFGPRAVEQLAQGLIKAFSLAVGEVILLKVELTRLPGQLGGLAASKRRKGAQIGQATLTAPSGTPPPKRDQAARKGHEVSPRRPRRRLDSKQRRGAGIGGFRLQASE
jgi:hypothetical protein